MASRFDLRAGDAGDAGDREIMSDFEGVVRLRSVSFLAGESILSVLSVFKGLLSPSGSGLTGFVFRTGQGDVAAGRIFPSIPGAIASLSVLLFIQTCEFRLFLSSSPLIPQAGIRRWGGVRGGVGRVTPVA